MINEYLYKKFEREIISKINRFKISKKDLKELKKSFENKIILISGAAGSIGSQFSKDILNYNFKLKKVIFLDKDENLLTELNRELLSHKNFRKLNIEFICSDLSSINISDILFINKVQFYLNFAAIKHVRSEENIQSIKYMFDTNSKKFIPKKNKFLQKIFSISTDKVVSPSSLLGISKKLMEVNLSSYKNKDIFVSTVRFANVAFSNGSVLKYAVDSIEKKKDFGLPINVKRFFITHNEASSLCFKALLDRNNKKILVPNPTILNKDYLITDLIKKITKIYGLIPVFYKKDYVKNNHKNNICHILLTPLSDGQKTYEKFIENDEVILIDRDKSVCKINLPKYENRVELILDKISKFKDVVKLKKYISKEFKNYKPPKSYHNISKTI